jgi:ABC-type lipoprotein release transport system permease subunit
MLKNYFKIAVRHLTTHKLFSLINILCLAIGISFSMIAAVYILNQRADLAWWIFASTGLGALFITLATENYQAIKAALVNPVKSLRTE